MSPLMKFRPFRTDIAFLDSVADSIAAVKEGNGRNRRRQWKTGRGATELR